MDEAKKRRMVEEVEAMYFHVRDRTMPAIDLSDKEDSECVDVLDVVKYIRDARAIVARVEGTGSSPASST